MKTFLKRISKVFFAFAVGIFLFTFIVHFTIRNVSNFEIKKDKTYLVFGHSHSECAFDDTILEGFKNLSSSGEGYFYTYQKVKQVIEANDHVKGIFLEFTNYSASPELDKAIWKQKYLDIFFPWHSSFMGKEEFTLLMEKNSKGFLRTIPTSTRDNFSRILTLNFDIGKRYGRFYKFERTIPQSEIENAKNKEEIPSWMKLNESENTEVQNGIFFNGKKVSSYGLKYLLKIVEFCKEKNVKIYLVRSPQHEYYPRGNEADLIKVKNSLFEDLDFLDFDRFPLSNKEFGDTEHLNYKGAKKFSSWLNNLITNGLLDDENKAKVIEVEIEKLTQSLSYSEK